MMSSLFTRDAAEDFMYREAALLEAWRLDEWHALFLPDGRYEIPALDDSDGDSLTSQFFVADDAELLAARVARLKSKHAHAENPASTTHRLVGNVAVSSRDDERFDLSASFVVHRLRDDTIEVFPGWYRHVVALTDDGPRFALRRVTIAAQRLRQGRLSFIL